MSERPDPIVKEKEIRSAKERLVSGMAESQRQAGMLPLIRETEDWVNGIVDDTVKKHEERWAKGQGDSPAPQTSPVDIQRHAGSFEWDLETNKFTPLGKVDPRFYEKPVIPGQTAEDKLIEARVTMLLGFPEWQKKIVQAWNDGVARTGRMSEAADDVMRVVEISSNVFGDWRKPVSPSQKLIIVGA